MKIARTCVKCGIEGFLGTHFSKSSVGTSGNQYWHTKCKDCNNKDSKERFARLSKEEQAKRQRAHRLKSKYGLTLSQFNALVIEQGDRCAICSEEFGGLSYIAIDHDHTTGKVRGLLCITCNSGLGHFKDNIPNLEEAIRYLKQHPKENNH